MIWRIGLSVAIGVQNIEKSMPYLKLLAMRSYDN